jgi:glucose-6-phosphate isomerase
VLATRILGELESGQAPKGDHDSSTNRLIEMYRAKK